MKAPTTTDSTKKRAKKQVQAAIEPTFDNPVPILPRRRVWAFPLWSDVQTLPAEIRGVLHRRLGPIRASRWKWE